MDKSITSWHIAFYNGHFEIVSLLLQSGKVSSQDKQLLEFAITEMKKVKINDDDDDAVEYWNKISTAWQMRCLYSDSKVGDEGISEILSKPEESIILTDSDWNVFESLYDGVEYHGKKRKIVEETNEDVALLGDQEILGDCVVADLCNNSDC